MALQFEIEKPIKIALPQMVQLLADEFSYHGSEEFNKFIIKILKYVDTYCDKPVYNNTVDFDRTLSLVMDLVEQLVKAHGDKTIKTKLYNIFEELNTIYNED